MSWCALIIALALWAVLMVLRWVGAALAFAAHRLAEAVAGVVSDLAIQLGETWLVEAAEDMTGYARRDAARRAHVFAERIRT